MILSFLFAAAALAAGAAPGCGSADLCADFEPAETRFGAPSIHFVRTTSLGTLDWQVENKADGNPGCSGWSALCAARLSLVPGRDGGSALKISTLEDDRGVSSESLERSEIYISKADTGAEAGKVQWWAHSVLVPADSAIRPQGSSLLQFHPGRVPPNCVGCSLANFILTLQPQSNSRPALIFRAYSAGTSATSGGLDKAHTQYTYSIGRQPGYSGQCLSVDFEPGVWYDFVHRIKWSYTDDGSHEIWMRKAGHPVTKVLHKTGINTLYEGGSALLKLGAYHHPVAGATSLVADRIRRSSLSGAAGADAVRMADFPVDPDARVVYCAGTGP